MFTPSCYKQLVVKCDYILQHKYFFLQLPAFTFYFHGSIISYHFIHSLLMLTHFTSNYYYTLKIARVGCIFACSYSLSHPFSFTIITQCRRVEWGEHGTYETLATLPLITPTPFKSQKLLFNKRRQREVAYSCIFTEVKHVPWQNIVSRNQTPIKQEADIGFPMRSIHSALYIHEKFMY